MGIRVQFQRGDQPVSDAPAFPLSGACRLDCNFVLERVASQHLPQREVKPHPTTWIQQTSCSSMSRPIERQDT